MLRKNDEYAMTTFDETDTTMTQNAPAPRPRSPTEVRPLPERIARRSFTVAKSVRQQVVRAKVGARVAVFVSGVARSGTSMMLNILHRSWETEVFHENVSNELFDNFLLRDDATVRRVIARSSAACVVIKALEQAHRLAAMLDAFHPAKAIWMFRAFDDVVRSNVRMWPGGKNMIDQLVVHRAAAEWRGLGMTDATWELVKRHYRPDMDDVSAAALFWYYRNQLLFDQQLDRDRRILIVCYEDLLAEPRQSIGRITEFLGLRLRRGMLMLPRNESRRYRAEIPADLRTLCDNMHVRLNDAYRAGT